jgi:hypothetical protein
VDLERRRQGTSHALGFFLFMQYLCINAKLMQYHSLLLLFMKYLYNIYAIPYTSSLFVTFLVLRVSKS